MAKKKPSFTKVSRSLNAESMTRYRNQLEANTCRHIGGDMREEGAIFCNQPRLPGSSWCQFHDAMCVQIVSPMNTKKLEKLT